MSGGWEIWADRGGTFTDLVARRPDGEIVTHKLLSENPGRYVDAVARGVRDLLGIEGVLPEGVLSELRVGTTVATNALLERKGCPTLFVTTAGFGDVLRIGYQTRPDLFARHIELPSMLYREVLEVEERVSVDGGVVCPLEEEGLSEAFLAAYGRGCRAVAICFVHGWRFTAHERRVADLARGAGFLQVSCSYDVSPLIKFVSRGDTTVADAYLSPILLSYLEGLRESLGLSADSGTRIFFMQSNGGLVAASEFRGKDAILSGPAGGVVGMVETGRSAGYGKLIGFDMGGTSTDVTHWDGEFERSLETQIAGVRLRAPMLKIETVAAGGGSVLSFDGSRFRVGPESAGADPGPRCYRRGGPLAVTDCNAALGRIQADEFPHSFGVSGDEALDAEASYAGFVEMAAEISAATGEEMTAEVVAEGFLRIAVENMANAIKKISVQRGYDVTEYTLNSFGGAGGQHACRVADVLGVRVVQLHPLAGVLSAWGIGHSVLRHLVERQVSRKLDSGAVENLAGIFSEMEQEAGDILRNQGAGELLEYQRRVLVRVVGSDTPLLVDFGDAGEIAERFAESHSRLFGFVMSDKDLVIETISLEAFESGERFAGRSVGGNFEAYGGEETSGREVRAYFEGEWRDVPLYR
ncbi:MAG: hydantoinase/oxoprolinase family protein, partial [Alphaproteobacteria bacterium]